jgi:hypothetical protein
MPFLQQAPFPNSGLEETMTGIVKTYDPQQFTGTIESDAGRLFLLKRNSMRRGTILKVGDAVLFEDMYLSDGPTAQQVRAVHRTCNYKSHLRLTLETEHPNCPICGRALFKRPVWKCKTHSVQFCKLCSQKSRT